MWPLVAMENTLFTDPNLDWPQRCATVAAAGFAGVYATPYPLLDADFHRLRDLAHEPRRHGLFLEAVYASLDLGQPAGAEANARVRRLFAEAEGAPRIELSFKCSESGALPPDVDGEICARLEPLLALAERRGFTVALYPHSFYPLQAPFHAERIVQRMAHPRLSYLFATSHVYAVASAAETASQLLACSSRIASFNVCGCRRPPPPAKCAHSPLDEGDLPLAPLFWILAAGGYRGSVIVQGHGWNGDLPAMLRRCVVAAQKLFPAALVAR